MFCAQSPVKSCPRRCYWPTAAGIWLLELKMAVYVCAISDMSRSLRTS